jgi:hypothetical protein
MIFKKIRKPLFLKKILIHFSSLFFQKPLNLKYVHNLALSINNSEDFTGINNNQHEIKKNIISEGKWTSLESEKKFLVIVNLLGKFQNLKIKIYD